MNRDPPVFAANFADVQQRASEFLVVTTFHGKSAGWRHLGLPCVQIVKLLGQSPRRQPIRQACASQRRAREYWLALFKQDDFTQCFVDYEKVSIASRGG